ncbi:eukaryotic translation initiation factor 2D [Malaya genurostris]|uniref:eukaryotic translation initiation factor 2D n=1 Tax=Malaya genurostris TaxID=325434 RepID=UPI0026F39577|nr:eukaryotic translation initiation factor 2D [Malaya genurostris]
MFVKPFKIKSNILLTGSERKRLKQRTQTQFGVSESAPFVELFGNKCKVCVVKIVTYNETLVTVYTSDKRPIFFELDEKLLPTVYTLWCCVELVPYFTTHAAVLPKLANGADLMIPGVVRNGSDLKSWGNFRKDDVVAVNLTSNRSAVAVGLLAHGSDDLYMCGGHGVCVRVLHVFGDKLWGMEPSVCQQIPLQGGTQVVPKAEDFPPLTSPFETDKQQQVILVTKQMREANINDDEDQTEEKNLDPSHEKNCLPDSDKLIKAAFLNALKLHGKKIQLPILTSNFYPQYVQPELPEGIEMKRSSFKKVGTFLKQMAENGLIQIKEEKKGVEKIVSLSLDHPELVSFYPYKIKRIDELDVGSTDHSAATPLLLTKMVQMYAVNTTTEKLFTCLGLSKGRALNETQVRNYVKDYVGRYKLIDQPSKIVTLDEMLQQICETESTQLSLSDLTNQILQQMSNTFEMHSQKGPVNKGGRRSIIHLTTATRSGNRKVTLISNLADYGVNISEFAKAVKLGAAASTSMTEVPGTKGEQLLVQGNHVKFVYDLLTGTYQIPKACITGLEFAKDSKKKKK